MLTDLKTNLSFNFNQTMSFILAIILLITFPITINAIPHFVYTRCNETAGNYNPKSIFQSTLNSVLSELVISSNSSLSSYSDSNDVVNGFYYCRGDVKPQDCTGCVQAAAARVVLDCPSAKEAVIWHEECTLGYSSSLQYSLEDEDVWISEEAPTRNSVSITSDLYGRLFDRLIKEAAYGNNNNNNMNGSSYITSRYFMTGKTMVTSSVSLQGLVQCSPQMSESQCEWCLRTSVGIIPSCCGWRRDWVMVFRASCLVEYRYANAIPTNRDSSTLLVPNAHSVWGYAKYFILLVIGSLIMIVAYYGFLRQIKYKLVALFPAGRHKPASGSSHKPKVEEPKEPTKHNDQPSHSGSSKATNEGDHLRPCPVCKGVIECPTHKQVSCIICKITDEIQTQQRVPPLMCPPMPYHPGVMWVCPIPNVNRASYCRANPASHQQLLT